MHTVLGLVEYDRRLGLEYLIGHLHLGDRESLVNIIAHHRFQIM